MQSDYLCDYYDIPRAVHPDLEADPSVAEIVQGATLLPTEVAMVLSLLVVDGCS